MHLFLPLISLSLRFSFLLYRWLHDPRLCSDLPARLSSVGSRSIDPVLVTVPVRVVVATVVRLSRAGRLGCSRCLGFVWLVGHKDLASVRWFDRRSSWLALLACLDLLL